MISQVRKHLLDHFRCNGRRGVIIQVYRFHHRTSSTTSSGRTNSRSFFSTKSLESYLGGTATGAGALEFHLDPVSIHIDQLDIPAVLFEGGLDFPLEGLFDQFYFLDVA